MSQFSQQLIQWQKLYGRHGLPWQVSEPYARWISEVMLQQTQVVTVIDYYHRFMERFPTVTDLASANEDEVMRYWAGLGYYTRARNLHKAAKTIVETYGGVFPQKREEWEALPGIGKSTAAAVTAFSFGAKEAILDGNVKRVLSRNFAITQPMTAAVEKQLWALAQSLLPENDIESYTQGLMDLGATVCTRTPKCEECPFQESCLARQQGIEKTLPVAKPKRERPEKHRTFFLFWHDDAVLLVKRTAKGVWQGLHSLPEVDGQLNDDAIEHYLQETAFNIRNWQRMETVTHDFSHYRLFIEPIAVHVRNTEAIVENGTWLEIEKVSTVGLPAPIETLLKRFLNF